MINIKKLTDKILDGYEITPPEAHELLNVPIKELCSCANKIREHYCGNLFDVCTILNVKSGKCSEDCKFCAQSAYYDTDIDEYPLLDNQLLKSQCLDLYNHGFKRVSFVASGRNIRDEEFENIIKVIEELKNTDMNICVSLGLLKDYQIEKLKENGVTRIHCNLESSENYFSHVCSTHSFDDKIGTLDRINTHNMLICSGGIFGLGETFEDRIDLAFSLHNNNVRSIPINILNPIAGTPVEDNCILSNDDVCRIVAIFRFINPGAFIRMAGGRSLLSDNGKRAFMSGSNSAILGNMLTTLGVSFEDDLNMIEELGYEICYSI